MIPKVIHYCWFGRNPLPPLALKCIDSWRRYCPDYEIKEWNEANFPLDYNDYVEEAYEAKKWAFVTDVVRLYALVTEGGIYMDTDVEVLKPLDSLLQYEAVSGFENDTCIPTGLMASEAHQPLFEELLSEYENIHFKREDGTLDLTTNVRRITASCSRYGFVPNNSKQTIRGLTLFPKDYFCPKDYRTKVICLTNNTMTIHHFDGSWESPKRQYEKRLMAKIRFLPFPVANCLSAAIAVVRYEGVVSWMKRKFGRR